VPHIVVENLTVRHGATIVLKDISLEIPDRRITAIIGPSGCGKTTLLKSFNMLLDLDRAFHVDGRIFVDGENLLADRTDVHRIRRKMGLLSQRPVPLPMSIFENVAYGPRIHRLKAETIRSQLLQAARHFAVPEFDARVRNAPRGETMGLLVEYYLRLAGLWDEVKDRLNAPASGLSVGQQQRLCLARGLAVEPEIILADEPTSALDPPSAQRIEDRFLELKDHYSIVVVTHTRAQAKRLADHVIFIYMGELVEAGPAEQVFRAPKDPRTKLYLEGKFIRTPATG
jgi:phosphate transport system ATP-binding protein